ncbi:MAG: redox-sensitive bicupin YhaK (pirin superfamily) [Bacteroidia bacterium]|jgi:redox-sensitive bicupin YhaK (pirin superfamily)
MSNSRRDFLRKTGLAASGVIIGSAGNMGKSEEDDKDKKVAIKKIRPLGFQWETQDPFLFCVHHEDLYPEGNEKHGPKASLDGRQMGQDFIIKDGWRMYHGQVVPGFPSHPHRGFETITVVRDGYVDHSDSLGGAARYGHGDVQWMTAGKGLQHAEMFPLVNKDTGNRMELFQIWLNLPKKSKMVAPYFKMNWSEDIPVLEKKDSADRKIRIEVLAGSFGDASAPTANPDSWAADTENNVAIYAFKFDPGAEYIIPKTVEGVNRSLYFFEGKSMIIEDQELKSYHAVDVDPTFDLHVKNGETEGQLLILQGKPLNEPVVQHGPFVMNTREEIQQAFTDYQRTGFGGWPWESADPVHGGEGKRFAKHPDGREEIREE